MKDSILRVTCPCCRAALEIDPSTEIVLSAEPPKAKKPTKDLQKAVAEIRGDEARRDEAFRRAMEAAKRSEAQLEKKFEGLVKRQGGKPVERHVRDIDLD